MQAIKKWRQTLAGNLVLGLLELLLAYGFASIAIDRGNLLAYAATIIFLVQAVKSLIKSIRLAINH